MSSAEIDLWIKNHPDVLLENLSAGLIITDMDGVIGYINPRLTLLTGYAPEPYLGKHIYELPMFSKDSRPWLKHNSSHQTMLLQCRHRYGHNVKLYSTVMEIDTPEARICLWTFTEIDLKEMVQGRDSMMEFSSHHDVRQFNHIEHELILAKESAERANRAKSEFLARMSHELRTPLNAILGFAQLLEFEDMPKDQAESVQHILKGGRHLLEVINEILDISRIEAGKMVLSLESIEVSTMVEEAIRLMQTLAHSENITIQSRVEPGVYIQADAQRLKQILINLISNAIKYNVPGGQVIVSVQGMFDAKFRIMISDTGKGIAKEKMHQLFTPFERLGAEATQVEGSGLGLVLTKHLVEAMNGTISLESKPGSGTKVLLSFPKGSMPGNSLGEFQVYQRQHRIDTGLQIVCIEQNYQALVKLEELLQPQYNAKFVTFMDIEQGVDYCQRTPPDLILLDLEFPEFIALDGLLQLRLDIRSSHVPVIAFGATPSTSYISEFTHSGLVSFIKKPLSKDELFQSLLQVLPDLKPMSEQRV